MQQLLKSSFKGQNILKYYEFNKILSSDNRSKLVDIISDQLITMGLNKGNANVEILANKIIEIFPNEDKVFNGDCC